MGRTARGPPTPLGCSAPHAFVLMITTPFYFFLINGVMVIGGPTIGTRKRTTRFRHRMTGRFSPRVRSPSVEPCCVFVRSMKPPTNISPRTASMFPGSFLSVRLCHADDLTSSFAGRCAGFASAQGGHIFQTEPILWGQMRLMTLARGNRAGVKKTTTKKTTNPDSPKKMSSELRRRSHIGFTLNRSSW